MKKKTLVYFLIFGTILTLMLAFSLSFSNGPRDPKQSRFRKDKRAEAKKKKSFGTSSNKNFKKGYYNYEDQNEYAKRNNYNAEYNQNRKGEYNRHTGSSGERTSFRSTSDKNSKRSEQDDNLEEWPIFKQNKFDVVLDRIKTYFNGFLSNNPNIKKNFTCRQVLTFSEFYKTNLMGFCQNDILFSLYLIDQFDEFLGNNKKIEHRLKDEAFYMKKLEFMTIYGFCKMVSEIGSYSLKPFFGSVGGDKSWALYTLICDDKDIICGFTFTFNRNFLLDSREFYGLENF